MKLSGKQIKAIREALNYTQDELAHALGYRNKDRRRTISRWEADEANPPPPAIILMQQLVRK
jgi:DNA-binding transcriptional regulator YiaG